MKTKTKPPPSVRSLARQTAELIAADLFTYGPEKAKLLVMQLPTGPKLSGPGWCEKAVADRIEEVLLRKHLEHWIDSKKKKG